MVADVVTGDAHLIVTLKLIMWAVLSWNTKLRRKNIENFNSTVAIYSQEYSVLSLKRDSYYAVMCCKCLTTILQEHKGLTRSVCISTVWILPTMDHFKLPTGIHWMKTWDKMSIIGQYEPVSAHHCTSYTCYLLQLASSEESLQSVFPSHFWVVL